MNATVETTADLLAKGAESHGMRMTLLGQHQGERGVSGNDKEKMGEDVDDVVLDPLDAEEILIAEQIIRDFYPLKN